MAVYRTGYTPKTLNAANKIDPWGTGTTASEWALMSYLSRVYNYAGKYLFTVNFRADGSSKLSLRKGMVISLLFQQHGEFLPKNLCLI